MPDPAEFRAALLGRAPEAWVDDHLASFQASYFASFDVDAVALHLELIRNLSDERPVLVHARPADGPNSWWIEVVGFDAFQFLSSLCTLLTVHGFSIVEGRVFTSEPPPIPTPPRPTPRRPVVRSGPLSRPREPSGPDRRRKLVDVFRVERISGCPDEPDWKAFQSELITLTNLLRAGKYDDVHHRLIGRFVTSLERFRPTVQDATLEPLDLVIDAEAPEFATEVRINARDSLGFLSLMASALALCGIRIVQAMIHTSPDGRIADTIWVTDRGGNKLSGEPRIRELRLSLILIEHFSNLLPHATNPETALLHFSRFATETMSRPDWPREFAALDRPKVLDALARVLGESEFLWEDYLRDQPETVLPMICDPAEWERPHSPALLAEEIDAAFATPSTLEERRRTLQRFKDREIFRADVRSILGLCGSREQFASELTDVAEVLIQAAFTLASSDATIAPPRRGRHGPAPSALCALGKFGGRELGFASDLELMLVYDDRDLDVPEGSAVGESFDQMVRGLREAIGGRRGGTFELDFRLRPYGRGGPPATSLTTFLNYYQVGGPAWGYERQALIRLRAVAGDSAFGKELEAFRDLFVYGPEPFDLDGLRRMRLLQIKQLVRPGTINAKYGQGALVDIEYMIQALQIAHGGRDPALRTPNTLDALHSLKAGGWLAPELADGLEAGYRVFRALVDSLRVVHGNAHDLTIPDVGSEEFSLLARRMRYPTPAALSAELQERLLTTRAAIDRLPELLNGATG